MTCTRPDLRVSGRVRTGLWQLAFTNTRPCAPLSVFPLAADSVRSGDALQLLWLFIVRLDQPLHEPQPDVLRLFGECSSSKAVWMPKDAPAVLDTTTMQVYAPFNEQSYEHAPTTKFWLTVGRKLLLWAAGEAICCRQAPGQG